MAQMILILQILLMLSETVMLEKIQQAEIISDTNSENLRRRKFSRLKDMHIYLYDGEHIRNKNR